MVHLMKSTAATDPKSLVLAIVIGVGAGIAGGFTTLLFTSGGPPQPLPSQDLGGSAVLASVHAKLVQLVERLDGGPAARMPAQPVGESSPGHRARDARIENLLLALERRLASRMSTSPIPINAALPRNAGANINELAAFCNLADRSPKSASWNARLLTLPEVVAHFGFPDKSLPSNSPNGGFYCTYILPPNSNGEREGHVTFYFLDGYVSHFDSRPVR